MVSTTISGNAVSGLPVMRMSIP